MGKSNLNTLREPLLPKSPSVNGKAKGEINQPLKNQLKLESEIKRQEAITAENQKLAVEVETRNAIREQLQTITGKLLAIDSKGEEKSIEIKPNLEQLEKDHKNYEEVFNNLAKAFPKLTGRVSFQTIKDLTAQILALPFAWDSKNQRPVFSAKQKEIIETLAFAHDIDILQAQIQINLWKKKAIEIEFSGEQPQNSPKIGWIIGIVEQVAKFKVDIVRDKAKEAKLVTEGNTHGAEKLKLAANPEDKFPLDKLATVNTNNNELQVTVKWNKKIPAQLLPKKKPGIFTRFWNWIFDQQTVNIQALVYHLTENPYKNENDINPQKAIVEIIKFAVDKNKPLINKVVSKRAVDKLFEKLFQSSESKKDIVEIIKEINGFNCKPKLAKEIFDKLLGGVRDHKLNEAEFFASKETVEMLSGSNPELLKTYIDSIVNKMHPVNRMHFIEKLSKHALNKPQLQETILDISLKVVDDFKELKADTELKNSLESFTKFFKEKIQNKILTQDKTWTGMDIRMKATVILDEYQQILNSNSYTAMSGQMPPVATSKEQGAVVDVTKSPLGSYNGRPVPQLPKQNGVNAGQAQEPAMPEAQAPNHNEYKHS